MNRRKLFIILLFLILFLNLKNIFKIFYPIKYSEYVVKYSKKYNVDPYLIYALIKAESNFDEFALSHKGAVGLMQITPNTGRYISNLLKEKNYKDADLFDPEKNIKYGVFYFKKLYNDFGNDLNLALAAYNAGEGNVRKWMINNKLKEEMLFKETKLYIKKVKKYYMIYKWIYQNEIL
ncbi:lytic transglycosylase domain-containing protein [Caloramator sp. CAR-1]|uniref:lytic transglycosylase domain-containing protein n=1 Tax=Caloramator sp. CAR-1 TaxID=3062777 RepID=UPI0026E46605|nr:lytic transglycosylase domain-containing protein [Caloramator sp. CAR-1]MDO6354240.1 lytic transglycosylase domain-containing protein [Caloramator sp. CAR-1]